MTQLYPNPDLKLLFYPNCGHEFEFYPTGNPDLKLFYPSLEIEFYPLIPAKNNFYPFIRKEHPHPTIRLRPWTRGEGFQGVGAQ